MKFIDHNIYRYKNIKKEGLHMKNLKSDLDYCAAGLQFKSTSNRKDLATLIFQKSTENKIDTKNSCYHHLFQCIKQCEAIARKPLLASTYQSTVENLLNSWDVLGDWTWVYRVLIDIYDMDIKKSCGL